MNATVNVRQLRFEWLAVMEQYQIQAREEESQWLSSSLKRLGTCRSASLSKQR
jgi:hypothetical protein